MQDPLTTADWQDFLTKVPPGTLVEVTGLQLSRARSHTLELPDVELYCSEKCYGMREFRCSDGEPYFSSTNLRNTFVGYDCKNCERCHWTFAVCIWLQGEDKRRIGAYKFGQSPEFAPRISSRVQRLIEEDRDLFLKGRRAESLGLGIGAFTYYRRVVENQKDRLFNKIIRVAEASGVPADRISKLKKAMDLVGFKREMAEFKDLMPESILINGHNPLTLLHKALSVGVHNMTDKECLERAHDIRTILNELADRAAEALKETKELDATIARVARLPRPRISERGWVVDRWHAGWAGVATDSSGV